MDRKSDVDERRRRAKPSDLYGQRETPAYEPFEVHPEYAENQHILQWWTAEHDALLAELIRAEHWTWMWHASERIVKATEPRLLNDWRRSDPLCKRYAWYNVLMHFAAARAYTRGMTRHIRKPKWKRCLLCKQRFIESSLPAPLVERLDRKSVV